jgi:hypothetical protein
MICVADAERQTGSSPADDLFNYTWPRSSASFEETAEMFTERKNGVEQQRNARVPGKCSARCSRNGFRNVRRCQRLLNASRQKQYTSVGAGQK